MKEFPLVLNHRFSDWELDYYWLEFFDSPACKVTKNADDSHTLTACRFEKIAGQELFESANKLVTMMTAIAKIEHGYDFQSFKHEKKVANSYVEHLGNESQIVSNEDEQLIALEKSTVQLFDKDGNPIPKNRERQERWYDFYVCQCDDWIDSTVMFEALSLFAEKTEPITLRNIYEILKDYEGGKDNLRKTTGITSKELSNLTRSLSHADMEGQNLHIKKSASKDDFIPMSLAAATQRVVQRLLKPWLIKRQIVFRLAEGDAQAKYLTNVLGI